MPRGGRSTRTRSSRRRGSPFPGQERELWRGLAQVAVGLTHARRGNAGGAVALLRRGAGHVAEFADAPGEVDAGFVAEQATGLALRIERDGLASVPEADLRAEAQPWLSHSPGWKSGRSGSAPAFASAATSLAVSANPVCDASTAAANTTPYTVPDGLSSGPPELPGSTLALISKICRLTCPVW